MLVRIRQFRDGAGTLCSSVKAVLHRTAEDCAYTLQTLAFLPLFLHFHIDRLLDHLGLGLLQKHVNQRYQ